MLATYRASYFNVIKHGTTAFLRTPWASCDDLAVLQHWFFHIGHWHKQWCAQINGTGFFEMDVITRSWQIGARVVLWLNGDRKQFVANATAGGIPAVRMCGGEQVQHISVLRDSLVGVDHHTDLLHQVFHDIQGLTLQCVKVIAKKQTTLQRVPEGIPLQHQFAQHIGNSHRGVLPIDQAVLKTSHQQKLERRVNTKVLSNALRHAKHIALFNALVGNCQHPEKFGHGGFNVWQLLFEHQTGIGFGQSVDKWIVPRSQLFEVLNDAGFELDEI